MFKVKIELMNGRVILIEFAQDVYEKDSWIFVSGSGHKMLYQFPTQNIAFISKTYE